MEQLINRIGEQRAFKHSLLCLVQKTILHVGIQNHSSQLRVAMVNPECREARFIRIRIYWLLRSLPTCYNLYR